jgi:hypothetical protein
LTRRNRFTFPVADVAIRSASGADAAATAVKFVTPG